MRFYHARPRLTREQQNRILNKLTRLLHEHPKGSRCNRVAWRLRYWLAGVSSDANWHALLDTIEHAYAKHRISYEDAVMALRGIGIDARIGSWQFSRDVEAARRLNAQRNPPIRAVLWELAHYRNAVTTD